MNDKDFFSFSLQNQDINSEKNINYEDNFIERKMQHFAIDTLNSEINNSKEEKNEISKKDYSQNVQRDNIVLLRGKNIKSKESGAQFKISPMNTFRMRASHIMTLNNDLLNDDKLKSLNYLKVI